MNKNKKYQSKDERKLCSSTIICKLFEFKHKQKIIQNSKKK